MKAKQMIDPKTLISKLTEEFHGMLSDESLKIYQVIKLVDEIPTVQAAEVVPCKECFWGRGDNNLICTNPHCTKSYYGCPVPPDHYCSYGERE